jgi:CubicO group peptidase (beta-lactamase class C family)
VTTETVFQAASISKTLNATVIMKHVQEGRLSLDENVNTYLTSWKLPDNKFTERKKVTIANLLSHTGGTTVSGFPGYKVSAPIPTLLQILKGEQPANTSPIVVDIDPGQRFRYSGGGTTILQLVLIELEKKPYEQILGETILVPLNMTNSTFSQPLPDSWKSWAATGHGPEDKPVEGKWHVYPEQAAAGLWTTPTDLAKFAIEHQLSVQGKSNRILKQEYEEKMMTPYIGEWYGLGWGTQKMGDAVYFQHSGGNEGFTCLLIAHMKAGYGAVVMVNSNTGGIRSEIMRSIAKEYDWESYLPVPIERVALLEENLNRMTGRFLIDSDRLLTIRVEGSKIMADVTRMGTSELVPVSQTELVSVEISARLRFVPGSTLGDDSFSIVTGPSAMKAFRTDAGRKIPYDVLSSGSIGEALNMYRAIRTSDQSDRAVAENSLNQLGYEFLRQNKLKEAIAIFRLNVEFYPNSFNVYDSLGEGLAANGEKEEAIRNYNKSLELNPNNRSAVEALKKLQD